MEIRAPAFAKMVAMRILSFGGILEPKVKSVLLYSSKIFFAYNRKESLLGALGKTK